MIRFNIQSHSIFAIDGTSKTVPELMYSLSNNTLLLSQVIIFIWYKVTTLDFGSNRARFCILFDSTRPMLLGFVLFLTYRRSEQHLSSLVLHLSLRFFTLLFSFAVHSIISSSLVELSTTCSAASDSLSPFSLIVGSNSLLMLSSIESCGSDASSSSESNFTVYLQLQIIL
ncbi:hypothetical protein BpHYR1_024967 [Brachionus plicatilis]|uniref:Uncharacterized protein n=1 Tax=Brachionus plicatilis TaxID=10195 RepID=A0A3M7SA79_BRAPC|nr:hypothetical protein BpHYR1_024967 [Brachionus plicatilis]